MPRALLSFIERERLAALRADQVLDETFDATLGNAARLAARLTGCPTALMVLTDGDRLSLKAHHASDRQTSQDLTTFARVILKQVHPLAVPDVTVDACFTSHSVVEREPGIRACASVPLTSVGGQELGAICVVDYVPKVIGAEVLGLLADLAQTLVPMIEQRAAIKLLRMTAKREEERFAGLIEAVPAALVLLDKAGKIRIINRQAEEMFGYAPAELEGKSLELLLPERFRERHIGLQQSFMNIMSSRHRGQSEPLFGLLKDGTELPVEIGLGTIDLDGEPMALAVIADVRARHKLDVERQRELERSNADLQEFAYAASHDLKAPLRAIAHLAEWVRADIEPIAAADTIDNLKLLQKRVARLQMLLEGLLAYSRAGRDEAAAEDVDIEDLARDVAEMLQLPAGFDVICNGQMPVIHTCRLPIKLVLKHLISNGFQHHDRDQGQVTVAMRLLGDVAEFRIGDDGPGIPERFHNRIFMIFQTLQSRDNVESAGLGLAIVKKLIENNGGQIQVESRPPARGTTFVFTWKLV